MHFFNIENPKVELVNSGKPKANLTPSEVGTIAVKYLKISFKNVCRCVTSKAKAMFGKKLEKIIFVAFWQMKWGKKVQKF